MVTTVRPYKSYVTARTSIAEQYLAYQERSRLGGGQGTALSREDLLASSTTRLPSDMYYELLDDSNKPLADEGDDVFPGSGGNMDIHPHRRRVDDPQGS